MQENYIEFWQQLSSRDKRVAAERNPTLIIGNPSISAACSSLLIKQ